MCSALLVQGFSALRIWLGPCRLCSALLVQGLSALRIWLVQEQRCWTPRPPPPPPPFGLKTNPYKGIAQLYRSWRGARRAIQVLEAFSVLEALSQLLVQVLEALSEPERQLA